MDYNIDKYLPDEEEARRIPLRVDNNKPVKVKQGLRKIKKDTAYQEQHSLLNEIARIDEVYS